jgi:hypothetical protein
MNIAYVVSACHPPYLVLLVIHVLAGFGNGLEDAAWNAWVGVMANANDVLGILHSFYGVGATPSPSRSIVYAPRGEDHMDRRRFFDICTGVEVGLGGGSLRL